MKTDINLIKSLVGKNEKIIIEATEETASTNEDMKAIARQGADEIRVLIADRQTKGKGSKGRHFFSPKDTGCYMSFLLRPTIKPEECIMLTTMAAVATAEAIEKLTDEKAYIKWVNDIYIGGKKTAGILTESAFISAEKIDFAVVGIGINLTVPEGGFPEEINDIAGALGRDEIKNELIAEIISRFTALYKKLPDKSYMSSYRKRLFFLGEKIEAIRQNGSFVARAIDIDEMCRLIVEFDGGERCILGWGEISTRIARE